MEYKKKQRPQKIKMLDGAIKTIMVDDSKTVGELLVTICSRIGECYILTGQLSVIPLSSLCALNGVFLCMLLERGTEATAPLMKSFREILE